jgi:sulfur carrier protein
VIAVNGHPNGLVQPGSTVRAMLDVLGLDEAARGVAVAVDAEVVPRAEWSTFLLADDAHVEVLTAVQGG